MMDRFTIKSTDKTINFDAEDAKMNCPDDLEKIFWKNDKNNEKIELESICCSDHCNE